MGAALPGRSSGKPKPFVRPSIDLGSPTIERVWQNVPVTHVSPGDMVADFGRVKEVEIGLSFNLAGEDRIRLTNVMEVKEMFDSGAFVFAFTRPWNG